MPKRPPRPCPHPGCRELTDGGRCAAHRRKDTRTKSARQRGYDSTWERVREAHLRRHPLCVECARLEGTTAAELEAALLRVRSGDVAGMDHDAIADILEKAERCAANEVDHIAPHRGDRRLLRDRSNLQSMCKPHHSSKTGRGE